MIVRLGGGLANTMFQWAFGRSVALARNEKLFFELKWMGKGETRAYSLGAYNVDVKFASSEGHLVYGEKVYAYDSGVYAAPRDMFFTGNWQTEKYFNEPIVRKELTLRDPVSDETNRVAEEISAATKSAFIHVRRGDYVDPGVQAHLGLKGLDYYYKGMDYIQERIPDVKFFVFSDEPDWCRQHFTSCRIVGHNGVGSGDTGPSTEYEDLWLMGLCNHAIIPNSSFGWFGAWFGDQKQPRIVVAPQIWFANKNIESKDIVPERWVKL